MYIWGAQHYILTYDINNIYLITSWRITTFIHTVMFAGILWLLHFSNQLKHEPGKTPRYTMSKETQGDKQTGVPWLWKILYMYDIGHAAVPPQPCSYSHALG